MAMADARAGSRIMYKRLLVGIVLPTLAACDSPRPAADAPDELARRIQAAQPATAPRPDAPTTPISRMLEIAGDFALSEGERAALETRRRQEPAATAKRGEAQVRDFLKRYDEAPPVLRARLRHELRARIHFMRDSFDGPLVSDLLNRHDPVLVEDAARKEVVSMADMRALDASNRFMAKIAGVTMPPLTEEPGERAILQRRYADDVSLRTALTEAGIRHAMVEAAWPKIAPARREAVEQVIRDLVKTPEAAADAARGVENAVVLAEQRRVERQRSNNRALADLRRSINQMHQVNLTVIRGEGILRALNVPYP